MRLLWKLGCCWGGILVGFGLQMPALSVELSAVLQAAQGIDPALHSAQANLGAAQENIAIARSRLLPQLNLQGSRQNTEQTTTQDTILGPQDRPFSGQSFSHQLSLRQGLIRPRDWVGLDVGQTQAIYGEYKYQSTRSDLWNRTIGIWLDLLAAQQVRDVYVQTLKAVSESARQERLRFEKGDGTRDSMVEAQAQMDQALAMRSDAEFALQARQRAFTLQTRLPTQTMIERRLPLMTFRGLSQDDRDGILQRILIQAPELLAAQAVERVNALRAKQIKYDHYPTLDLVVSAIRAQNDSTNTLGYRYHNNQIGVQYTVPLYAGGGVEATSRQAQATYAASVADREALQMRLETQFVGDWATQAGLHDRVNAAGSLKQAAHEQRRAADLGLERGLRTWTDRGNAELQWARRANDLINLQLNMLKVQVRILALLSTEDDYWQAWVKRMDLSSR